MLSRLTAGHITAAADERRGRDGLDAIFSCNHIRDDYRSMLDLLIGISPPFVADVAELEDVSGLV